MVMERNECSSSAASRPHADALRIRDERLRQRRLQQQTHIFIPGVSDATFCGVVDIEAAASFEAASEVASETNQPVHQILSSIVQCDYCHRSFISEKIFVHHRLCTLESPLDPIDSTPLGKRDKRHNKSELTTATIASDRVSYEASIKSKPVGITDTMLLLESFQQRSEKTSVINADITDLS